MHKLKTGMSVAEALIWFAVILINRISAVIYLALILLDFFAEVSIRDGSVKFLSYTFAVTLILLVIPHIIGKAAYDKKGKVACGIHLLKSYHLSSATVHYDAQNQEKRVRLRLTLRIDELCSCFNAGTMPRSDCTYQIMEAAFPFSPRTTTDLYVSVAGARRIKRLYRRNRCRYVQLEFRIKEPYFGRHTTLGRDYILFSDWDSAQIVRSFVPDEFGTVDLCTGNGSRVEMVFAELDALCEDLEPDTFIEIG